MMHNLYLISLECVFSSLTFTGAPSMFQNFHTSHSLGYFMSNCANQPGNFHLRNFPNSTASLITQIFHQKFLGI
jgi:hypothetical protein